MNLRRESLGQGRGEPRFHLCLHGIVTYGQQHGLQRKKPGVNHWILADCQQLGLRLSSIDLGRRAGTVFQIRPGPRGDLSYDTSVTGRNTVSTHWGPPVYTGPIDPGPDRHS